MCVMTKLWIARVKGFLKKHISYQMRISLVLALFAIIPFLSITTVYLRSEQKKWENNALNDYAQELIINCRSFDRRLQEMKDKLIYINNSTAIRSALAHVDKMSIAEGLDYVNLLQDTVEALTANNKKMTLRWYPVLSTREYGSYSYTLDRLEAELNEDAHSCASEIMNLKNGEILVDIRKIRREAKNKDIVLDCVCAYIKMSNMGGSDCIVEATIPLAEILDFHGMVFPKDSFVALILVTNEMPQMLLLDNDTSSELQSADTSAILQEYFANGSCEAYQTLEASMDAMPDSKMVCVLSKDFIKEQTSENTYVWIILIALFGVLVLSCSFLAGTLLTSRINEFVKKMNDELDHIVVSPEASMIENSNLGGIEVKIRQLVQHTLESYTKLEQSEAEKNKLELELLQMRFNPHFLYNTLASVRYQVKDQHIRSAIDSLVHYYRIVLNKGHLMIRVEEEMDLIREYLKLERFTYQLDNIHFRFEIEDQIKNMTIIKHLLQPIVENALKHGLRASGEEGNLWIRGKLVENEIVFEVEDDGVGMTEAQAAQLLLEPTNDDACGGYGVYNVQQRMKTYYGESCGLSYRSRVGEGTCAILRIPIREGTE